MKGRKQARPETQSSASLACLLTMDHLVDNKHFLGQKEGKEGKKNPPSGWDEDEAACPWGPCPLFHPSWEGTMTSSCNPNPARPGQIRPDVCLRSRRPLAPTVEDGPEEYFQAQAAVTVPELCEEVKE